MDNSKLRNFLREFMLDEIQLKEVYKKFCEEIRKGLSRSPQADIKCFLTYVQQLPTGMEIGKYLALDLGGTNFRVLLVTLEGDKDNANIVSNNGNELPQNIKIGSGTQLFDHIAKCLAEFVAKAKVNEEHLPLGFTFSFPCVQLGLAESVLVKWTKGFKCTNVEGKDVGHLLREAIARRNDLKIDVMAILNDTTGTLMSCAHRNPACRIGVIIGTGCNACYVERTQNIEHLENALKTQSKHMLINTEWGAFGENGSLDFIRTRFDKEVDNLSLNAGNQLFEKMISGMYLGELMRLILLEIIGKNLIFDKCTEKFQILKKLTENVGCFETQNISQIEKDNFPNFTITRDICKDLFNIESASIEDCQKLKLICEVISRRAAALVGVALSGLTNRINEPNIVIGVDGSLYRLHPKFDSYMRETMRKFVHPEIKFDLMLSHDGSGRGAALVAAVANEQYKS